MNKTRVVAVFVACFAPILSAQTVDPFYATAYTATDLGGIAGLPTPYGGLIFKAGDTNTILIGGAANTGAGRFYSVPVTRGAGGHIVSFGAPTVQGFGVNNDGGVAYGPGGVFFYSQYSLNNVGQVKPGSTSDDKTVALGPLGIATSTGALNFVPSGYNGAGQLKISSWSGGQFYNVSFAADGSGTYNLTSASLVVTLPGGPEGFIYVPLGSPQFPSQSMLVAEYSAGSVATYTTDANGNPVLASRRDFITGLTGAEGSAIDPVTGDFLFSTFGSTNRVIQVRGFVPPLPATSTALASSTNPSTVGQSVTFTATVTGTSPTGTVTFQDGAANIAGCVGIALVASQATCTTSALAIGSHAIAGNYSGDAGNAASSGSVTQTVNSAGPPLPPAVAVDIPTLSQWGVTLLIVLLASLGAMRLRRTRH